MPGVSASVAEQLASLRRFGGVDAGRLVRRQRDETIARIVAGWPAAFDTGRAATLGFVAERTFDDIVRVYIDDELGGRVPEPAG
jgi:hypothetical protein